MPLHFDSTVRSLPSGESATVVRLVGSLDASTSSQVSRGLGDIVLSKPQTVVFDLAGLEFIDSSGISVILSARNDFKKIGTRVVMAHLQKQIKKVFEIVKALPGVAIFDDIAQLDAYLAKIQREALEGGE